MRIGIFTDRPDPKIGGAFTLLHSIIQDIIKYGNLYEFVIFIKDEKAPARYIENNLLFINYYFKKPNILIRIIRKLNKLLFNKTNMYLNNIFHKENIDLLWLLVPNNIDTDIPFVFTVWDLGHRMLPCFPEVSGEIFSGREELYQKMLIQATYIVTGNNTGKNEILNNYSVNPEKIFVIPFPIPSFCLNTDIQNILPSFNINKPFIFYPAQFWAHKNHVAIIEAIAWLRDCKDVIIYCYFSGHDHGNQKHVSKIINKYNLNNQIFILGFISQHEIYYLYKNALAMVFASLMGPNNLPPLEAMAIGCPLLYSNIAGHIEQMEDAGYPVDATDSSNIGEAIYKVYSDSDFRNALIQKGFEFTGKYKSFSYFREMQKIIDKFNNYYKTWNE